MPKKIKDKQAYSTEIDLKAGGTHFEKHDQFSSEKHLKRETTSVIAKIRKPNREAYSKMAKDYCSTKTLKHNSEE